MGFAKGFRYSILRENKFYDKFKRLKARFEFTKEVPNSFSDVSIIRPSNSGSFDFQGVCVTGAKKGIPPKN